MALTRGDTRARILDTAWGLVRERGSAPSRWPTSPPPPASPASSSTSTSRTGPGCWWPWPAATTSAAGSPAGPPRPVAAAGGGAGAAAAALVRLPARDPARGQGAGGGGHQRRRGRVAWRDRMGDLRELFAAAVERVDRDGRLADGWSVAAATDWVWARAQPATFQHLVGDRAWPRRLRRPRRPLDPGRGRGRAAAPVVIRSSSRTGTPDPRSGPIDSQRSDALVFFGATGDLAYKEVFPALHGLVQRNRLDVPIIGVARSGWDLADLRRRARDSVEHDLGKGKVDEEAFAGCRCCATSTATTPTPGPSSGSARPWATPSGRCTTWPSRRACSPP